MQFQLITYFHCKAFHLLIRASAMLLSMYNLTSGRDSQVTGNKKSKDIWIIGSRNEELYAKFRQHTYKNDFKHCYL